MKKISRVLCLLLAAIMVVSFSACKKSTPAMFTYKDMTMSSGMYAFILAERKGEIVDYFKAYYGRDISSDDSFWSSPFEDNKTYAEWLKDTTEELCKRILIVKYFCNQYELKITDETQIQEIDELMDQVMETFGGEDELKLELAKYGITLAQLREYYEYLYYYQLLLDYWYGENGTMRIPEAEVREKFFNNFYKIDMAYFSYYTLDENNNTVPYVDKSITDEQAKAYFDQNYVKVQHILYMTVDTNENPLSDDKVAQAEQEAKAAYEGILNGSVNYDDIMKEKSDSSATMIFTRGDMVSEFENASFEMEPDEVRLVQTKYGWHIIRKLTTSDDDFDKKITEVRQAMSKEKVKAGAEEMYENLKENKIEFKEGGADALYQFQAGRVISREDAKEDIIQAIDAAKPGEYILYEFKDGGVTYGYYIFRRVELDESDLRNYYETVEDEMKDAKYFEYVQTHYDSIAINEEELAKYDNIPAVQSFPSLYY